MLTPLQPRLGQLLNSIRLAICLFQGWTHDPHPPLRDSTGAVVLAISFSLQAGLANLEGRGLQLSWAVCVHMCKSRGKVWRKCVKAKGDNLRRGDDPSSTCILGSPDNVQV